MNKQTVLYLIGTMVVAAGTVAGANNQIKLESWTKPYDDMIKSIYKPQNNRKSPPTFDEICDLIRINDIPALQKIIEETNDFNKGNDYNFTPLHLAAQTGKIKVVELFVNKLITRKEYNKIMSCDSDGRTPVHYAAMNGYCKKVVDLIVDNLRKAPNMLSEKEKFTIAEKFLITDNNNKTIDDYINEYNQEHEKLNLYGFIR